MTRRRSRNPGVIRRALRVAGAVAFALVAALYLTLPDVRPLATTNPTTTAFMELRAREAERAGRTLGHDHRWVPYARISPHLIRAVLVAEDDAFWTHQGIDVEQIRQSMQTNFERGAAVRGGSTITQQLAKNLYLSPSRDPLRKLRELIIARRLEAALSKQRILEIYLNVIEWGDGVWGVEAAARSYFRRPASALTREQAALLAGAVVNPRTLDPARPTARLRQRQRIILARMGGAPSREAETRATAPAHEPLTAEPAPIVPAVAPAHAPETDTTDHGQLPDPALEASW